MHIHHLGRAVYQEAAHLYLRARFGHVLEDSVELGQWLPKRLAVLHPPDHVRERSLSASDQPHAVVDAAGAQPALADFKATALAEKDVADWYPHMVEEDLHVALGSVVLAEGLHRSDQCDARRVHRHQDLGLLGIHRAVGPGLPHQDHDLAVQAARAGDVPLPAVDHILAAGLVPPNADSNVGGVGRGHVGLGHREARPHRSLEERDQPAGPLLIRAVPRQHLHVPGVGRGAVGGLRRKLHVRAGPEDLAQLGVLSVGEAPPERPAVEPRRRCTVDWQEHVPQPDFLGLPLELHKNGRPYPLAGTPADLSALLVVQLLVRVDVFLHEAPQRSLGLLELLARLRRECRRRSRSCHRDKPRGNAAQSTPRLVTSTSSPT
mmetsp:Transcript_30235/g.90680  ORF Transcript_30235/g.90680 Transcript_30235/m.90680 type:complete len:377 (-) Transcript_30235:128-1258(-)